jgi:hypothetical protein
MLIILLLCAHLASFEGRRLGIHHRETIPQCHRHAPHLLYLRRRRDTAHMLDVGAQECGIHLLQHPVAQGDQVGDVLPRVEDALHCLSQDRA